MTFLVDENTTTTTTTDDDDGDDLWYACVCVCRSMVNSFVCSRKKSEGRYFDSEEFSFYY